MQYVWGFDMEEYCVVQRRCQPRRTLAPCGVTVDGEIIRLLIGPSDIVMKFDGYIIHGLKFRTKQRESNRKKENRRIVVTAWTESYSTAHDLAPMAEVLEYYEIIKDIIEVYYYGYMKVVIFNCVV